ncbi:hypothetical protein PRUPE_4G272500 [Prunus persica]|uniref:Uncharacterized protein n=1 Tax=Prunus persica TaxID=3760 RepID=A0A251PRS6_PRUPE|nr:hypothetical protein PRUPE_4G272500 [Prunus persica]
MEMSGKLGFETHVSPLKARPCGPGSLRILVSLLPLHDSHDSHNSREVYLQVSSSTRQRVTLPCDNTITPHPATNP